MTIFELRRTGFEEVLYLYNALLLYDLDEMQPEQPRRRQRYADEVDWFD